MENDLLNCPKCSNQLTEITVADIVLDQCCYCKGLWFDDKELAQVLSSNYVEENQPGETIINGSNDCPRCKNTLDTVYSLSLKNLEVDICPNCKGIWLDYGEFTEILNNNISINFNSHDIKYPSQIGQAITTYQLFNRLNYSANKKTNREQNFSGILYENIDDDTHQYEGKVKLKLTGFKNQTIISIDEIVTAIEKLPDRHLAGLRVIRYDPERFFQKFQKYRFLIFKQYFPIKEPTSGEYDNKNIIIYEFNSKTAFLEVLYHEIGHYVFYNIIDSNDKHKWVTRLFPDSEYVSEYASTRASEDFAETYMYFILYNNLLLKNQKDKYDFMSEKIFSDYSFSQMKKN